MPVYGLKIGTGPMVVTLAGNVHRGEHIGPYAMGACVDYMLNSDLKAVEPRSNCTFYFYSKFNPQAHYAGSQWSELTTGTTLDSNRIWWRETKFDDVSTLMMGWVAPPDGTCATVVRTDQEGMAMKEVACPDEVVRFHS